jgi:oligopeptide transport system substrate-binding protein
MRPLTLLIAALLTAVAVGAEPAPQSLRRTAMAEPPSLDPTLGSAGPAAPILSDLVEGLVARTPAIKPAPAAAESWTTSADGRTWTFRLRPGLRWSDGTPLTAGDFVYSYRRLIDPATAAPSAGLFFVLRNARAIATAPAGVAPLETLGVSAPDARTVVFELEFPAPYFAQLLANTQAAPVPRHVIEKLGREWARPGNLVSNGPYRLAERVPQGFIRLERNPGYREAAAVAIESVYWYPGGDMGAALRRFRAGELDVVLNVAPDDLPWIRANIPQSLRTGPIHATYTVLFNTRRAPFDDVRVRRALALAVDREAIALKLLKTGVRPAYSWVSPGIGGYPGAPDATLEAPLAERQREARQLLAAAGFGSARPLSFQYLFDSQEENRKIAVALQAMWKAVGVAAQLENAEFSAVLGRLRSRDFAVARSSTFSLYDDAYAYLNQLGTRSPTNWTGYGNPRYDALLGEANSAADEATRHARFQAAERLLHADMPLLPIYYYQGKLLVAPRVQGWWDGAIGTPPSRYLSLRP